MDVNYYYTGVTGENVLASMAGLAFFPWIHLDDIPCCRPRILPKDDWSQLHGNGNLEQRFAWPRDPAEKSKLKAWLAWLDSKSQRPWFRNTR